MAEFFHAGRTNADDCYDAGKHVHGSRMVYGHGDASRSKPAAYADDCNNGGEVGALAAGASSTLKEQKAAAKERRAHDDDHFYHHQSTTRH